MATVVPSNGLSIAVMPVAVKATGFTVSVNALPLVLDRKPVPGVYTALTAWAAPPLTCVVINGGRIKGLKEAVLDTLGRYKIQRRPDILVERPDGTRYEISVGLMESSGAPVLREAPGDGGSD